MDLTSAKNIKEILLAHGAQPSKLMGQNFLVSRSMLDKIIQAAELKTSDTVVEVGPGIGVLTQALAEKAGKVISIEKDRAMLGILESTLQGYQNIEVVQADALQYPPPATPYKVVANIPYYLTSPLIRMFLESNNPPLQLVLMVQKEVAQRICAKPGDMSILAVSVQFYASVKIMSKVSKECFWPAPKVDSAIISIIPNNKELPVDADTFFKVVKAGFLQPRKQLGNNFTRAFGKPREAINLWLVANSINPLQRAETLGIPQWVALAKSYQQLPG